MYSCLAVECQIYSFFFISGLQFLIQLIEWRKKKCVLFPRWIHPTSSWNRFGQISLKLSLSLVLCEMFQYHQPADDNSISCSRWLCWCPPAPPGASPSPWWPRLGRDTSENNKKLHESKNCFFSDFVKGVLVNELLRGFSKQAAERFCDKKSGQTKKHSQFYWGENWKVEERRRHSGRFLFCSWNYLILINVILTIIRTIN